MNKYLKIGMLCCATLLVILILSGEVGFRYAIKRRNYSNFHVQLVNLPGTGLYAKEQINEIDSHRWVILVHSYGADHSMMNEYAAKYLCEGYNALSPDNRAHGISDGEYIGMGYLDQIDIYEWIRYILEKDEDAEIVLHGISMGATALMILAARDDLPDNVRAVVEDSGYVSADRYLSWKLNKKYHLPAFPILQLTNIATRIHAGYWLTDASAINAVPNSRVPILFIHGTSDSTVPVEDVYQLFDSARCKKELHIAQGALHGEALSTEGENYWAVVFDFIKESI